MCAVGRTILYCDGYVAVLHVGMRFRILAGPSSSPLIPQPAEREMKRNDPDFAGCTVVAERESCLVSLVPSRGRVGGSEMDVDCLGTGRGLGHSGLRSKHVAWGHLLEFQNNRFATRTGIYQNCKRGTFTLFG